MASQTSLIVSKYITLICIKPCYDHLDKAIEESSFKYKMRLSRVVPNEMPFLKR